MNTRKASLAKLIVKHYISHVFTIQLKKHDRNIAIDTRKYPLLFNRIIESKKKEEKINCQT